MAKKTVTISDISGQPCEFCIAWEEPYIDAAGSRSRHLVQYDVTGAELQRIVNRLADDHGNQDIIQDAIESMSKQARGKA
jgi:hypothetical protein